MRTYTAEEIRRALATVAAAPSMMEATRITGIPRATLMKWRDGNVPAKFRTVDIAPTEQDIAAATQAGTNRAMKFREIETLYMERLRDPEVVKKTASKDAAVIVGILEDKAVRAEGGGEGGGVNIKVAFVTPGALKQMAAGVIDGHITNEVVLDLPALPAGDE